MSRIEELKAQLYDQIVIRCAAEEQIKLLDALLKAELAIPPVAAPAP
jgi:hypothetical protein